MFKKASPEYHCTCSGEDSTTNGALWDWPLLTHCSSFSTMLLLLANWEWHPQPFPSLLKLLGTANSGPSGDEGRVSTEERKRKFAVLLPALQDSCAEVTEYFLDPAPCGVLTGNSLALPPRAGLQLSSQIVSKTSWSLSTTEALELSNGHYFC